MLVDDNGNAIARLYSYLPLLLSLLIQLLEFRSLESTIDGLSTGCISAGVSDIITLFLNALRSSALTPLISCLV